MADTATKHFFISGGTIITDLKSLSSLLKTRRSVAFVYAFLFAFVAFTVFLAFSPSPNSSSPWFTNIFSTTTTVASDSYRSHFSSIFSYFLPNDTSPPHPQVQPHNFSAQTQLQPPSGSHSPALQTTLPTVKPNLLPTQNHSTNASFVNNKQSSTTANNHSQAINPNQTTIPIAASPSPTPNQTQTTTNSSLSSLKNISSSSLLKKHKHSNGTNPEKQGIASLLQNLMNCDLFDGEWVIDDSYPLYKPGSCSFIDEQFNCILNGRPDKDYQKYKWKPKQCSLPRLNSGHMLDLLRGKRLVFVGDSLNRNMWESLVCILRGSVKDQTKVFEANGRHHFRGEASYSFIFEDYNCTIEFFVSPFLVQEWEMPDKNGSKKETLRLDLVGKSSSLYKGADIIIFNTGHWWTHEKTSKGKDYYQEGSHVYDELNVLEAFRKALTTWARWVDANINPTKSVVFFRGYSASHFSGGQWNSGGACDSEVEPIKNVTYLIEYPPKMMVLEKVLKGMKTHVTYLNVTRMTDYRKDGHPSIYRKQNLSEEERISPLHYQDCSHWCLPGVPDAWNEILYAELLINEQEKQQAQKRHR